MKNTLNDLAADFKKPIPGISWAAGTFVCTLTGPFGTYENDTLGFRFLFWGSILFVAVVYSLACVHAMRNMRPHWPLIKVSAVAGPIFIITYSVFIILLIRQLYPQQTLPSPLLIFTIVTCITITIQVFIHSLGGRTVKPSAYKPVPEPKLHAQDKTNPFLAKIGPDMGTKLIRLQMRDHYVEAYTCRGMQLIHMRFSDAVAALSEFNGLQVHRSHWVNLDEVCNAVRKDGKACFYMSDGAEVPVSRGKIKELKEMGILS